MISIIVIILHLIYRYPVVDTVILKIDFLIFLFFIPALYLLLDNFIIIEGDHGDWTISKVKKFGKRGVVHQMINVDNFSVELNVVSNFGNSTSLIVLKNKIRDMKIKAINFKAKEFQDECEIINLHVIINKRGKIPHD